MSAEMKVYMMAVPGVGVGGFLGTCQLAYSISSRWGPGLDRRLQGIRILGVTSPEGVSFPLTKSTADASWRMGGHDGA